MVPVVCEAEEIHHRTKTRLCGEVSIENLLSIVCSNTRTQFEERERESKIVKLRFFLEIETPFGARAYNDLGYILSTQIGGKARTHTEYKR